jgi:hypothetical protein
MFYHWFSVLALASLLSVGLPLLAVSPAIATRLPMLAQAPPRPVVGPLDLPPSLVKRLQQDLSRRTGLSAARFRVVDVATHNWPDGCLGLAKPEEICTQAIVPGWQVSLSEGKYRWVYRTDQTGKIYRLQWTSKPGSTKLKALTIQGANLGTLPDGSTDLGQRTSEPGEPVQIPSDEMSTPLEANVIFQVVSSGGIAGRTWQIQLLNDGRLLQKSWQSDGDAPSELRRLSPAQVRQFQTVLSQAHFEQFHRRNYLPPPGSADFITVTLTSRTATVRYADISQGQLPRQLQAVIQAWRQLQP